MRKDDDMHWVGTWASTPDPVEEVTISNQTVRIIARLSIGGARLRVRISNAHGTGDLVIGAAQLALRSQDASIVPGSTRRLDFHGSPDTTIPAGALAVSDVVELDVPALSDLAVSLYLPGKVSKEFGPTGHDNCHQTNYLSPAGDFTATEAFPVEQTTETCLFLSGVETLAPSGTGGVVAFGDSLTEGNISTLTPIGAGPTSLRAGSSREPRAAS